ncbi:catalase, partial [Streptomyces sp. McG5]|uniref:catalase n=1 Tax=Streptomyces sp. McG5 TaxID=2725484 RepID=UPI001BE9D7EF
RTYRHMDGFSSHTYMWVNEGGERFWVKYRFKTDQGIEFYTQEVAVVPVRVTAAGPRWQVAAGPLRLEFTTGRRTVLGLLLRAVPVPLGRLPAWAALLDGPARLLPGVRTRGSAGGGRREWYGAHDLRRITAARATWRDRELGALAPVEPPVAFGFGSTPRRPALVRVTTTVETARSRPRRGAGDG